MFGRRRPAALLEFKPPCLALPAPAAARHAKWPHAEAALPTLSHKIHLRGKKRNILAVCVRHASPKFMFFILFSETGEEIKDICHRDADVHVVMCEHEPRLFNSSVNTG